MERLELRLHPWSGFLIMPLFALANAGVRISWSDLADPTSAAVFAGLVLGKPVGVLALSWIAVRIGLATRPADLTWRVIAGGALLTGIGFTMSLFIAALAFPPPMLAAAKLGILAASMVAGAAGLLMLRWVTAESRTLARHPGQGGLDVPGCSPFLKDPGDTFRGGGVQSAPS